jgi:hypothetical protein
LLRELRGAPPPPGLALHCGNKPRARGSIVETVGFAATCAHF